MSRDVAQRAADVARLLAAARDVYKVRASLVPALVLSTGLTAAGVELGFECLERDADAASLRSLVKAAGDASAVHVVLSANVFVAPLRALALARAAADLVTVRPSARDPTLTRALVEAAGDPGLRITHTRDVGEVSAGEIHVYGRSGTIAAVRSRSRPGVVVRPHGPGLGLAVATVAVGVGPAASAIARDVVLFDQRGCLSPRIVFVEGHPARAEELCARLHEELDEWARRVPRGALQGTEAADAAMWAESLRFAGRVWSGADHAVALALARMDHVPVPPPGRHVQVVAGSSLEEVAVRVAPLARFVVSVGTDDPARVAAIVPVHARVCPLGRMQEPPLDGPVDRRPGPPLTELDLA